MTDSAAPEVLIIGDSHAIALRDGCEAQGLPVGMLATSGNFWHMGEIFFDDQLGIRMRGNRVLAADAERLRQRLGGGPVLRDDLPVIVSAGFNLGRLVPKLMALGHVSAAAEFEADGAALFLSRGFLEGYVAHHRDPQLQLIRRLADAAPVTVVAPPLRGGSGTMRAVFDVIAERMRAAGLDLYDPLPDLAGPDAVLGDDYYTEDGSHGNVRYGRAVIERLLARGALRPKAA